MVIPIKNDLYDNYETDQMNSDVHPRQATLYRMVMEKHICPYGLKAKDLLERNNYEIEDHHLKTREETDQFKKEHGVSTTPQIFIDGVRIGGYDKLREYFDKDANKENKKSYQPIITLFSMTFLMAFVAASVAQDSILSVKTIEWFIAFSMCFLAYLKLRDIETFSTMFLNYDLLARRWVRYGYIYPFAEATAGILMIGSWFNIISIPIALFIGSVGALSVIKAVYIDKRELKCACVGGDSNVPLGFISLTENIMMILMALWMLIK